MSGSPPTLLCASGAVGGRAVTARCDELEALHVEVARLCGLVERAAMRLEGAGDRYGARQLRQELHPTL